MKNPHPKWIEEWDDARSSGNGIIVTLAYGWSFEPNSHEGVRGFDTLKEAKEATLKKNIWPCECDLCLLERGKKMTTVTLSLTTEQARAVSAACDLYARICLGQFHVIERMVRFGEIQPTDARDINQVADALGYLMTGAQGCLGHPPNGNFGVGNPKVSVTAHRAFETRAVINKALAEFRDPKPEYRGVDYNGLIVRYTDDPAPVAKVWP
jgi:hypothetical protein